jgi:hypothetical protein
MIVCPSGYSREQAADESFRGHVMNLNQRAEGGELYLLAALKTLV